MIYEIVNPSDAYTMDCEDFKVACVTTCLLGGGAYALEGANGKLEMPPFLLGGHDAWFKETFGCSFEEALNSTPRDIIAKTLNSIVIGKPDDRKIYLAALDSMTDPAKRQEFDTLWHDARRSSMNDIGGRARAMAARFLQTP